MLVDNDAEIAESLCPLFFIIFFFVSSPNDSPLKTMRNVFYFI